MVPNHARSLLRKGYFYFRREFQRSKWTSAVSRSLSSSSSSSSRSDALLASHNQEIVIAEKQMLAKLHELLRVSDASKEELDLVVDTRTRIEDFFTVVVCGEFNSGKSTLINAMFGEKHLKEGLLPTTNKIHIVRTKQQKLQGGADEAGKMETTMNLNIDDVTTLEIALQDRMQWLKDIAIIDTPGTNAIVKKHEELTQKIIPRADMILFVTSAERPLTESESTFLSQIQKWGKNVIMVVNKVDLLEDQQSMTTVMDYVKQNAGNILNLSATDLLPVFGVSGKSALDARLFAGPGEDLTNDTDLRDMDGSAKQKSTAKRYWRRSNLEPFENFLKDTLMQEKLIGAKLDTVLVVADRVLLNLKAKIDKRQALLDSDFRVLALLEENLAIFEEDFDQTGDDYKHRLNDILTRFESTIDDFLASTFHVSRIDLLMNPNKLEVEVKELLLNKNIKEPIDHVFRNMSDDFSKKARLQFKRSLHFIIPNLKDKPLMGKVAPEADDAIFEDMRSSMLTSMQKRLVSDNAQLLAMMDHETLTKLCQKSFQTTLTSSVFGMSIGGLLSAQMFDATGILTSLVVLIGGVVSMTNRRMLRTQLLDSMRDVKHGFSAVTDEILHSEKQRILTELKEHINPYSRFVHINTKSLQDTQESISAIKNDIVVIKERLRV